MTDNIASLLIGMNDQEKSEFVEFVRGYSNKELINAAQSSKYSNFNNKIRELLFPVFRAQERDIARIILSEKGIDYKIEEMKTKK